MGSADAITTLVSRFASLSPNVRMKIAVKLLHERDREIKETENHYLANARRMSLLEQLSDEVEAAYI